MPNEKDAEIPCSAWCADVDVCRANGCSFRALDEPESTDAWVPDLDASTVTVMVPTAPRTTASTSPPDPSHVPMTVTLRQLATWLKEAE